MTVRFMHYRLALYLAVFLLSGTVLGLGGHLASLFLPSLHKDFTIFNLIIPSLTIFILLLTFQFAVPWMEATVLFILATLWLSMGAWATDIIGNVQCDGLGGQRTATRLGSTSAQSYCYEMKVVQAFSWMAFVLLSISFIILICLVSQAQRLGRFRIWYEPIRELGWFGEWPGYYNTHMGGVPMAYPSYGYAPGTMQNGMMPGQPGQTIIIQGNNPPTVVPMGQT